MRTKTSMPALHRSSAILAMVLLVACTPQPAKQRDAATELLKGLVKMQLKDPESATFRNLDYYTTHIIFEDGDRYQSEFILCGEVNAKNSYGGYVGHRAFIATFQPGLDESTRDTTVQLDEPDSESKHTKFLRWQRAYCHDASGDERSEALAHDEFMKPVS